MPAPDRLSELLRQRALIQEHLAWLEREIAAASGKQWPNYPAEAPNRESPATPKPAAAAPIAEASPVAAPATTTVEATVAEEIIDQYRVAPDTLKTDVRKGCLLYFLAAFVLIAGGIAVLYFLFQRGR